MLALAIVAQAENTEKLHIEGSTTAGPIADGFAEVFKDMYPDVTITVNKSGSATGAAALMDGRCDIATMSRFTEDQEFKNAVARGVLPVAHVVAMDGVCIVLHPSSPINALRTEQVRDICLERSATSASGLSRRASKTSRWRSMPHGDSHHRPQPVRQEHLPAQHKPH